MVKLKDTILTHYINSIKSKYRPSANLSVAQVNPKMCFCELNYSIQSRELSCLLTGYKKIYYLEDTINFNQTDNLIKKALNLAISSEYLNCIEYNQYIRALYNNEFQFTLCPDIIQYKSKIIYYPEYAKQALLINKYYLEVNKKELQEPGSWYELENPYLMGILLNYKVQDIKFYYVYDGFIKFTSQTTLKTYANKPFCCWPNLIKTSFNNFKKKDWKTSESYQLYKIHKSEASKWLNSHQYFTLINIKAQITKLHQEIKELLLKLKLTKN